MKRIAILSLIVLLPVLAACNTFAGMGKDIGAIGKGLSGGSSSSSSAAASS
jgi:predicted small secreted protein